METVAKRFYNLYFQIQFVSYLMQAILGLRENCGFPRWMGYGMLLYMVSMLTLFGNFYYKTYRDAKSKQEGKRNSRNDTVLNGVTQNGSQKKIN
jgi:hypothetical protein